MPHFDGTWESFSCDAKQQRFNLSMLTGWTKISGECTAKSNLDGNGWSRSNLAIFHMTCKHNYLGASIGAHVG